MTSRPNSLLTLTLIPALALAACKGDERPTDTEAGVDTGNEFGTGETAGEAEGDGDGDGDASLDMPDNPVVVGLKIEPANAVLEIVDGVIPPELDFAAIATSRAASARRARDW
jgi:hypothetical protein